MTDHPAALITPAAIRAWLQRTLEETGISVTEWARRANVHKASIHRAMKPDYPYLTSLSTLTKLAMAVGAETPMNAALVPSPKEGMMVELPIFHEVAAGAWLHTEELFDVPPETARVLTLPPYEEFPQWLERVRGDSYNQKIPDGSLVHVVDAIAIQYQPKSGDTVVVVRERAQGAFRERSLKEVQLTPHGIELWPRSFNPRWALPLKVDDGLRPEEDAEVHIVGKVLRSYQMFDER